MGISQGDIGNWYCGCELLHQLIGGKHRTIYRLSTCVKHQRWCKISSNPLYVSDIYDGCWIKTIKNSEVKTTQYLYIYIYMYTQYIIVYI